MVILNLSVRHAAMRKRRSTMTVCIAAFAANAKAIVLVADKSVSYVVRGHTRQKFDVAFKKIHPLRTEGWAAMIAGPMDFGEHVVKFADCSFQIQEPEMLDDGELVIRTTIQDCMKEAYQICRGIEVVDKILKPRLLSKEWYERKINDAISKKDDDYFIAIEGEINAFDLESSILLCGLENGRPEIYTISNPGVLGSESAAGLAAIGIGQETALNRLYSLETDPDDSLEKVLYDTFDAKEACSESLPEVGREWDAFVICKESGVIQVPDSIQVMIEQVYDNHPKSPFKPQGGSETPSPPPDWREVLSKWCSDVLGREISSSDQM
jgi:hypothetical protein